MFRIILLLVFHFLLLILSFNSHSDLNIFTKNIFLEEIRKKEYIKTDDVNLINDRIIRMKRKIRKQKKYKWTFPIYFYIRKDANTSSIRKALHDIQLKTCIRFREVRVMSKKQSGIYYFKGDGCNSELGKKEKYYWVKISIGEACEKIPLIQHETLHALGFDHEHSRRDRNDHLYLFPENMDKKNKEDFLIVKKKHSNTLGIPYDYGSLMHYDIFAHSKNNDITMFPKNVLYSGTLGQVDQLSFNDVKALNLYYCANICRNILHCQHGGYQNPNFCIVCKCIRGFTGRFCEKIAPPLYGCGSTIILAQNKPQTLEVSGTKKCIFHIKTYKHRKIMLKFDHIHIVSKEIVCKIENSLEIKFSADKTVTGARFCGKYPTLTFLSKDHYVIIYYNSMNSFSGFKLRFKMM